MPLNPWLEIYENCNKIQPDAHYYHEDITNNVITRKYFEYVENEIGFRDSKDSIRDDSPCSYKPAMRRVVFTRNEDENWQRTNYRWESANRDFGFQGKMLFHQYWFRAIDGRVDRRSFPLFRGACEATYYFKFRGDGDQGWKNIYANLTPRSFTSHHSGEVDDKIPFDLYQITNVDLTAGTAEFVYVGNASQVPPFTPGDFGYLYVYFGPNAGSGIIGFDIVNFLTDTTGNFRQVTITSYDASEDTDLIEDIESDDSHLKNETEEKPTLDENQTEQLAAPNPTYTAIEFSRKDKLFNVYETHNKAIQYRRASFQTEWQELESIDIVDVPMKIEDFEFTSTMDGHCVFLPRNNVTYWTKIDTFKLTVTVSFDDADDIVEIFNVDPQSLTFVEESQYERSKATYEVVFDFPDDPQCVVAYFVLGQRDPVHNNNNLISYICGYPIGPVPSNLTKVKMLVEAINGQN